MQPRVVFIALLSAALGCAAAVGLVQGFGLGGGQTTTVVQQTPLAAESDGGSTDKGLTAREIYRKDAPGVVFVRSQIVQRTASPFDFGDPQEQQGEATGSGFVIARDGTILTNAHVVNGASRVTVQFADKKLVTAKVLGKDESTDLALLKAEPKGLDLHPLALGDSASVQVGDPAIAIGNPFGLERTLTTGVISAVKRTIQAPNNFQIDDVIQTDAPINPGNSGGPLIDAGGRVIGVNSQIETGGSGSTGNVGIGFAVPIDTAKKIIPQLKASGRVDRGYLGVATIPVDSSLRNLGLPTGHGALVQSVTPGSPADKAGLKAGTITAQLDGNPIQLGGDIITRVDATEIRSKDDLTNAVQSRKRGAKVKITFFRGDRSRTVEVTLAEQPASVQNTAPSTP
jgi:S1-C subfamily serine protease